MSSQGNCDFESNEFSLCKWANVKGDSFDWTTGSGSTPSSGTGPDSDHTKGAFLIVLLLELLRLLLFLFSLGVGLRRSCPCRRKYMNFQLAIYLPPAFF